MLYAQIDARLLCEFTRLWCILSYCCRYDTRIKKLVQRQAANPKVQQDQEKEMTSAPGSSPSQFSVSLSFNASVYLPLSLSVSLSTSVCLSLSPYVCMPFCPPSQVAVRVGRRSTQYLDRVTGPTSNRGTGPRCSPPAAACLCLSVCLCMLSVNAVSACPCMLSFSFCWFITIDLGLWDVTFLSRW